MNHLNITSLNSQDQNPLSDGNQLLVKDDDDDEEDERVGSALEKVILDKQRQ